MVSSPILNQPPLLSAVVAADRHHAIGKDGALCWHLPREITYFRHLTWGFPVIMGRKTFDSLPKPLQGRLNIVVRREQKQSTNSLVRFVQSADEALHAAASWKTKEIFIIGGQMIYTLFLPRIQRVYMSRVYTTIHAADTFFPLGLDEPTWHKRYSRHFEKDSHHSFAFCTQIWERQNHPTNL